MAKIRIRFDGPPGPVRFVGIEDADGHRIRFGRWVEDTEGDGRDGVHDWFLEFDAPVPHAHSYTAPAEHYA